MPSTLIIVPCGQAKVWDKQPVAGAVPARDAYIGAPFKVNRAYADRFADRWVILSARYGFIAPDFLIPGPYNVTFKRPVTGPIAITDLRAQLHTLYLTDATTIIALGGKDYQAAVRAAFEGIPNTIHFPFAGLPIGRAMQATRAAIEAGTPLPLRQTD